MELCGTKGESKIVKQRRKCVLVKYKIFKMYYIVFDQIGNVL